MFSNVGWGEIFFLFVIGLIVIGPERLPRLIQDARAAIFAARNAIEKAKRDLSSELGPEFDDISKPLTELATLQRMGPKAVITKTLLEGDNTVFEALDPKNILDEADLKFDVPTAATTKKPAPSLQPLEKYTKEPEQQNVPVAPAEPETQPDTQQPPTAGGGSSGGGFSWADVT